MQASERIPVQGSERELVSGHRRVGDADLTQTVTVTVYLRPSTAVDWVDEEAQRPPAQRRRIDREQWAQSHGASQADIDAVTRFAADSGLTVVDTDRARRTMRLQGSLQAVAAAFEATIEGEFEPEPGGQRYRGRSGSLTIPRELAGTVSGVFGIDDRPQARPHLRRNAEPAAAAAAFTPPQVATAYAFPSGSTGAGETVGILELGGGYSTTDLTTY
ncbi:MAG: protease pro-enzyme activation domain-containing protein, partial [Solirubrobacteraceae bacterium]